MRTRAVQDGTDWVINGEKTFITGGLQSDFFVVGARTAEGGMKGISLFFVRADAEGFSRRSVGPKMGWWASDTATLNFDDVRVPEKHMIGEVNKGFLAIMKNFNNERLSMAAQMLGMSRRCYDEALQWARERKTFGQLLVQHQVIRHKLVDMSTRIDALEALLYAVCYKQEQGLDVAGDIAKLKVLASKTLEYCASEAMQVLGGMGYLRGNAVERIYRDVKVMAIGGGSEEIMRDLASRQMGL